MKMERRRIKKFPENFSLLKSPSERVQDFQHDFKMNKRGWLKVLEAVIAITLLIGVLLYMMSSSAPRKDISNVVYEKEKYILDTISKNDALRNDIVNNNNANVNYTIEKMIPITWDFETRICELDSICQGVRRPLDKDVYSSEIIVTSNKTSYNPKKIRLFVWVGGRTIPAIAPAMSITTIAWDEGGEIDDSNTCGGGNSYFPLEITNIPINTKSLVITFTKKDDNQVQWLVYNIPAIIPTTNILNTGLPASSIVGLNHLNNADYRGPCPSDPGVKTYVLNVYAVDIQTIDIPLASDRTIINVMNEISGHILANDGSECIS